MSLHVKNDEEFDQMVQKAVDDKLYLFIKFSAPWCGPCKMIQPTFDKYAKDCKTAICISVNVEECQRSSKKYDVTALPTFVVLKDNKLSSTFQGANKKTLKKVFELCSRNEL